MEPNYNSVVSIHSGDCVIIDELHCSKVLPEPRFILGPDNAVMVTSLHCCFIIEEIIRIRETLISATIIVLHFNAVAKGRP